MFDSLAPAAVPQEKNVKKPAPQVTYAATLPGLSFMAHVTCGSFDWLHARVQAYG